MIASIASDETHKVLKIQFAPIIAIMVSVFQRKLPEAIANGKFYVAVPYPQSFFSGYDQWDSFLTNLRKTLESKGFTGYRFNDGPPNSNELWISWGTI